MSHTKGKWIKTVSWGFPTEIFCERKIICSVLKRSVGHEQADANANLICAAPALLEALEEFTEMYCEFVDSGDAGKWNPEDDPEVVKARAAIALARGNS